VLEPAVDGVVHQAGSPQRLRPVGDRLGVVLGTAVQHQYDASRCPRNSEPDERGVRCHPGILSAGWLLGRWSAGAGKMCHVTEIDGNDEAIRQEHRELSEQLDEARFRYYVLDDPTL